MMAVKRGIRAVLRALGLLGVIERLWWRLSSRWMDDVKLVSRQDYRAQLDSAIARIRERIPADDFGDYLEFGVYNGSSMSCAFEALRDAGLPRARLIGFDSFQGMPAGAAGQEEDETFKEGILYFDEYRARANLKRAGVDMSKVVLVKGWYEKTLTPATARKLKLRNVSLVMIDCVIYSSTATVLRFLAGLLRDPAVLIFDDWTTHGMHLRKEGQSRAFEEFLEANPHIQAREIGGYPPNARVFLLRGARGQHSAIDPKPAESGFGSMHGRA
jgi:hypothetical protein